MYAYLPAIFAKNLHINPLAAGVFPPYPLLSFSYYSKKSFFHSSSPFFFSMLYFSPLSLLPPLVFPRLQPYLAHNSHSPGWSRAVYVCVCEQEGSFPPPPLLLLLPIPSKSSSYGTVSPLGNNATRRLRLSLFASTCWCYLELAEFDALGLLYKSGTLRRRGLGKDFRNKNGTKSNCKEEQTLCV